MLMEIDEVLVDKDEWEKVKAGNKEARDKMRQQVNGLNLYFHLLIGNENDIPVTLRELQEHKIVNNIVVDNSDFWDF